MLQEELEYLRKLQKGKPVDRGRCADHLQKVLEEALVLRDVTRFYLGCSDHRLNSRCVGVVFVIGAVRYR